MVSKFSIISTESQNNREKKKKVIAPRSLCIITEIMHIYRNTGT